MRVNMKKLTALFILIFTLSLPACTANNNQQSDLESQTSSSETSISVQQTTEQPTTEKTKEQKEKDAIWKKLYIEKLAYFSNKTDYKFCLAYVDEDDIPELIAITKDDKTHSYLFWINNSNVCQQSFQNDNFFYLERKNCLLMYYIKKYPNQTTKKVNKLIIADKIWTVTEEWDYIYKIENENVKSIGDGNIIINDIDDPKIEKEIYKWDDNRLDDRSEYESERNKFINPDDAQKVGDLKSYSEICKEIRNY